MTSVHVPWSIEEAKGYLALLPEDERLILPALQELQSTFGYVHPEAVALIALTLNVSIADVHGVLTFYCELRTKPPAPITLAVCIAEACQANGSRALVQHLEQTLTPMGSRTPDGLIDLIEVFCLGNCALGPAALINERLLGRLTPVTIQTVLDRALWETTP